MEVQFKKDGIAVRVNNAPAALMATAGVLAALAILLSLATPQGR